MARKKGKSKKAMARGDFKLRWGILVNAFRYFATGEVPKKKRKSKKTVRKLVAK